MAILTISPIYIIRYLHGGADAFNEDIAITYIDYADMVARWDNTISCCPPTLLEYTTVETRLQDNWNVYDNNITNNLNPEIESFYYGIRSGFIPDIIEEIETNSLMAALLDSEQFLYKNTRFGQSTFVLNPAYFTTYGFVTPQVLVDELNIYSYENIIEFGSDWLYEAGQYWGETFTKEDAKNMVIDIYLNEIRDPLLPTLDILEDLIILTQEYDASLSNIDCNNATHQKININTVAPEIVANSYVAPYDGNYHGTIIMELVNDGGQTVRHKTEIFYEINAGGKFLFYNEAFEVDDDPVKSFPVVLDLIETDVVSFYARDFASVGEDEINVSLTIRFNIQRVF